MFSKGLAFKRDSIGIVGRGFKRFLAKFFMLDLGYLKAEF